MATGTVISDYNKNMGGVDRLLLLYFPLSPLHLTLSVLHTIS